MHCYTVASVYIETVSTRRGKKNYKSILLRESFREDGKVRHRTIANLTSRPDDEIAAIRFALQHKGQLPKGAAMFNEAKLESEQGLSVGAILVLSEIAKRLGITQSLGSSREGKLALWQVIARIIQQGSRLGATRLAETHAACDVLGLGRFVEDHLYHNLDWLASKQMAIEDRLFKLKQAASHCHLFLYDVTSSYLEGECNEFAEFGYNRDKKKGKKQIVIGLLTDHEGEPVSVQVFHGNTSDNTTVLEQIQKIVVRFGVKRSIFVGDRGMLKDPQLAQIGDQAEHITALTTVQTRALIKDLALVEWAFRTCKEEFLELRPHYVQKAKRTKGHVFIVMLAYKVVRYLAESWKDIEVTVEEGIQELDSICLNTIINEGKAPFRVIPKPRLLGRKLLEALNIQLPSIVPDKGIVISARKKTNQTSI